MLSPRYKKNLDLITVNNNNQFEVFTIEMPDTS